MLGNTVATDQRTQLARRHRRRNRTLANRAQKLGNLVDEPMSDLTKLSWCQLGSGFTYMM